MKVTSILFLFFGFSFFNMEAQTDNVVQAISDIGFENVRYLETSNEIFLSYENNIYRFEAKGLAFFIKELSKLNLSNFDNIHIQIRNYDIPMVVVSVKVIDLLSFNDGLIEVNDFAERCVIKWKASDFPLLHSSNQVYNSSFFKIDNPNAIRFDYSLGDFTDGLKTRVAISSKIFSTLAQGLLFNFDFNNLIQNDIPGRALSSVRALNLTQGFRIDNNIFFSASMGYLPGEKFGFYSRFRNYLKDESFYIEMIYGVTRTGYLDQNWIIQNNRNSDAIWQIIMNYRWNKYDTDVNLTYGTFFSNDLGYKFNITRQFNEVYVNLFYSRTDLLSIGSFGKKSEGLIGFSLTVPFGQSKYTKPRRLRFRTDDEFSLLYRYSGLSFSGIDIPQGRDIFSDIREFYPEVLRKGLLKYLQH